MDYRTVPQEVLDYFKGYTASPLGSWWDQTKNGRYTDSNGYQWIPNWEDGSGIGLDPSNYAGSLLGYRRSDQSGEVNDPFRANETNLYYSPDGKFSYVNTDDPGWLTPATGILAVASLGLGAGALAAGGEAAGAIGAGEAAAGAGGSGAFLGEGVASGIGAWDGAMTGAAAGGAGAGAGAGYLGDYTAAGYGGLDAGSAATMGGGYTVDGGAIGGAGAMGAGGGGTAPPANPYATGGTAPPANPYATGGGGMDWSSMLSDPNYAQLLGTALGAIGGAQGTQNSATSTRSMDPRMDSLFYGNLAPQTQGLLGAQLPAAYQSGNQMISKGSGLLAQTAPDTATNPYATGILNDMQRRNGEFVDQRLQGIAGNSVGVGGLGGSRQGVAQAQAISQGADNFAGQGFNFMGGLYNADQNRLRQDWTLGAGLMGQGLDTQFKPLQNTANIYQPFTGFGSTTNSTQQGGGWQGALGGALGAAQFGQNMGWWGNNSNGSTGMWG